MFYNRKGNSAIISFSLSIIILISFLVFSYYLVSFEKNNYYYLISDKEAIYFYNDFQDTLSKLLPNSTTKYTSEISNELTYIKVKNKSFEIFVSYDKNQGFLVKLNRTLLIPSCDEYIFYPLAINVISYNGSCFQLSSS
jgi:hypothetical protein